MLAHAWHTVTKCTHPGIPRPRDPQSRSQRMLPVLGQGRANPVGSFQARAPSVPSPAIRQNLQRQGRVQASGSRGGV